MKFVRRLVFAGLGVGSAAALVLTAQGCGSTATETGVDSGTPDHDSGKPSSGSGSSPHSSGSGTGTPSSGSGSGSHSGSGTGTTTSDHTDAGRPPGSMGTATTATTPHNFAIRNLYLGDSNADAPTFTANANAWENFGYNIDGLITTAQSKDVCSPFTAGTTMQQIDGTNGIDNSFESQLITQIGAIASISSSSISADIAAGKFTLEIDTVGLDGTATQTATGLTGQLFAGSTYTATSGVPAFNTGSTQFAVTDDWPVNGSLLTDPTMPPSYTTNPSTVAFPNAYVTAGTWVSGPQSGSIALSLSLAGVTVSIQIHAGVITMPVTKDAQGQFHTKVGIVSGVIETSEFLAALDPILAKLGACAESTIAVNLVSGAQDIILSGSTVTNVAGTPCNAISIGLAFDADEIAQPDTTSPATDAGAPASCTSGSGSGS